MSEARPEAGGKKADQGRQRDLAVAQIAYNVRMITVAPKICKVR